MIKPEDRAQALTLAGRCAFGSVTELRAAGKKLAGADLDALLAKAVAREAVELELDMLAYEQGKRDAKGNRIMNRNRVRVRDGGMMRLGSSGVGTPFLRDHLQYDVTARGGTITASKTTKKTDDGHYEVHQTVRLTEPSAVERALRGNMSAVSVGLNPIGPVNCTACGTEVLSKCWHWPGDMAKGADGVEVEVEWEFSDAELVETSEVSVPAVPTAAIDSFRAALALGNGTRGPEPQKAKQMIKLCTMLGLAATAGEDEITRAVESQRERLTIAEGQRDDLAKQNAALAVKVAAQEEVEAALALDAFRAKGVTEGKFAPDSKLDAQLTKFFKLDRKGAEEMLASMPRTTPIGAAPERDKPEPKVTGDKLSSAELTSTLADNGVNPAAAIHFAKKFGCKNPEKHIAAAIGFGQEA